jgi:metal-responsive CopG/Arc/MetJ family transcriptional regulator
MKNTILVGLRVPKDIVRAIDSAVVNELLTRSDWIRKAILDRLCQEELATKRHTRRGLPA